MIIIDSICITALLVYLSRRGIELSKYRSLIRFNPEKIQLIPKNPVIPGCVKIKAEGVEILKPIRNLLAEVEMRIGGTVCLSTCVAFSQ
jgi:hypothetical protein